MHKLVGLNISSVEDLEGVDVAHLMDWPKSEFAAYIFGANEPSGRLFTSQHEFVIIDNEQMFSTGPSSFDTAHWVRPGLTGAQLAKGFEVAARTCSDVARITPAKLSQALAIPRGVAIERKWSISTRIKQSLKFATAYARAHADA